MGRLTEASSVLIKLWTKLKYEQLATDIRLQKGPYGKYTLVKWYTSFHHEVQVVINLAVIIVSVSSFFFICAWWCTRQPRRIVKNKAE